MDRAAVRAEYRIGRQDKFLLCVGRLFPTKRITDLVAALAIVRKRCPHWRLVVIGDGPLLEPLQEEIAVAGLSDEIFLQGKGKNLIPVMQSADLFVFPPRSKDCPTH